MTREEARLTAVTKAFSAARGLPLAYARADVAEVLQAAAEWDAVQDAPTVRDLAEILGAHVVKPTGLCSCGVQVNNGDVKGLERAAALNRHRAMVIHAAGYRWAPDLDWEWAAVGPRERGRGVETYSWGTEAAARALYARMVGPEKIRTIHPVVLVRRTPAGMLEEVERWTP
jgi:hypothetical protein